MNTNLIVTALLALVIVVFIFARQIIQRPVTQQSLLLPLILSVALGGVFLVSHPAPEGIVAVVIGAVLGVGTGLVGGQLIRVWRDEATGIVFQRGGWRYLIVLIVLLLARVVIRFLFTTSGSAISVETLPRSARRSTSKACFSRLLALPKLAFRVSESDFPLASSIRSTRTLALVPVTHRQRTRRCRCWRGFGPT